MRRKAEVAVSYWLLASIFIQFLAYSEGMSVRVKISLTVVFMPSWLNVFIVLRCRHAC
jgi:uncharacterized membrane protein